MIGRRQTRDDPRRAVGVLLQQIGLRLPTSLAEAQAAAHIDAALRRVGMSVNADTFLTLAARRWSTALVALLGLLAAAGGGFASLPALLIATVALLGSLWLRRLAPQRGESQNIVATRPAEKLPHWRVVLLARLDAPVRAGWLGRLGPHDGRPSLWRSGALVAIVALQVLSVASGDPLWWWLQGLPAALLMLLLLAALLPASYASNAAGAGALAALVAAAERAKPLRSVELWAVALGAMAPGTGLRDFLARYPFPRSETLFIGLDQLDGGRLAFVTREGTLPVRYADPYLLNLMTEIDAGDPLIDAEPRPARNGPTLVAPLLARGYRALTLTSYDRPTPSANGAVPPDPLDALDGRLIDQAARLVVGVARKLDG